MPPTPAERVRERLSLAVEDVRLNGKMGRSIGQIAKVYKCNKGSLRDKLSRAGLLEPLNSNLKAAHEAKARAKEREEAETGNDRNSIAINPLSEGINSSGAGRGGEGGNLLLSQVSQVAGPVSDEDRLKGLTSEVRRVIESSIRAGAKVLKCETPGDLERLYKLYRETFRSLDGGPGGVGRGLIQVNILGDSSAPVPRMVKAIEVKETPISDGPSESVAVPPAIEAGQGAE